MWYLKFTFVFSLILGVVAVSSADEGSDQLLKSCPVTKEDCEKKGLKYDVGDCVCTSQTIALADMDLCKQRIPYRINDEEYCAIGEYFDSVECECKEFIAYLIQRETIKEYQRRWKNRFSRGTAFYDGSSFLVSHGDGKHFTKTDDLSKLISAISLTIENIDKDKIEKSDFEVVNIYE